MFFIIFVGSRTPILQLQMCLWWKLIFVSKMHLRLLVCIFAKLVTIQMHRRMKLRRLMKATKTMMIQNDKITLTWWETALYIFCFKVTYFCCLQGCKPNITANLQNCDLQQLCWSLMFDEIFQKLLQNFAKICKFDISGL